MRRRDLLTACLGTVALAGCSGRREASSKPRVAVVRAPAYGHDLYDRMRRLLSEQNQQVRGKRIVLKPNLVEFDERTSINTNPLFVHAVYEAFAALGAAEIRIAEGPGHRRDTFGLAEAAGYFDIFPRFEEVFTDLNLDETVRVRLGKPFSQLEHLYLPKTVLRADLLVSLPKMKTHHWAGATLAMKNLFGIVPGGVYGWPKNVLHWAGIDECVADLHRTFPRTFAIVDGVVGMEGNGPIQGTPKPAGLIVAGPDAVAVDATCCRLMGIDPWKVQYLKLANRGQLDPANVEQTGESIEGCCSEFALIPELSFFREARPAS
jgi:uncharacterized protein (DUF362 family)